MRYSDFTPELKDHVLNYLCEHCDPYRFCTLDWMQINEDSVLLNTCLSQFKDLGLVEKFGLRHTVRPFSVVITADAYDFLRRGGFTFLENKYLRELEKANLELEKLQAKPGLEKYVKQISGVTGIISNLISAAAAFRG